MQRRFYVFTRSRESIFVVFFCPNGLSRRDCYLNVWLLQQVKELLILGRDVRFGRQQVEDLDIDVHRVREHGEELVIFGIVDDFVVNIHQSV